MCNMKYTLIFQVYANKLQFQYTSSKFQLLVMGESKYHQGRGKLPERVILSRGGRWILRK
jgi:hypothetical protein